MERERHQAPVVPDDELLADVEGDRRGLPVRGEVLNLSGLVDDVDLVAVGKRWSTSAPSLAVVSDSYAIFASGAVATAGFASARQVSLTGRTSTAHGASGGGRAVDQLTR